MTEEHRDLLDRYATQEQLGRKGIAESVSMADSSLLFRDLPHRDAEKLRGIAQNLTILLWSDFRELVCAPDPDPETAAVQRELESRILGSAIGV